jgi:signal peptidase I
VVVLALVVGVFYVAFDFGSVDGPSMLPNLLEVDGLLITKGYSQPRRGDVVVLRIVGQNGKSEDIVKRVIGIAGDSVEIRNDVAFVNGAGENGYRVYVDAPGKGDTIPPVTVPKGSVYVMGDNRPVSYDSRYIGPQPLSAVSGRVAAIYMPLTRWRLVPRGTAAGGR